MDHKSFQRSSSTYTSNSSQRHNNNFTKSIYVNHQLKRHVTVPSHGSLISSKAENRNSSNANYMTVKFKIPNTETEAQQILQYIENCEKINFIAWINELENVKQVGTIKRHSGF